jgi:hypothetical protein
MPECCFSLSRSLPKPVRRLKRAIMKRWSVGSVGRERWGQGKRMTSVGEMLGTGNAGDRERECVGVWVCGEREGSRVQIKSNRWGQGKGECVGM